MEPQPSPTEPAASSLSGVLRFSKFLRRPRASFGAVSPSPLIEINQAFLVYLRSRGSMARCSLHHELRHENWPHVVVRPVLVRQRAQFAIQAMRTAKAKTDAVAINANQAG